MLFLKIYLNQKLNEIPQKVVIIVNFRQSGLIKYVGLIRKIFQDFGAMIIKNYIYILFIGLLSFITVSGCDDPVSVNLNEEFYLSPGQKAEINSSGLEITFNRVLEDSRCPKGVECVWEGNGRIEISVSEPGFGIEIKELNTTLGPRQTEAGKFKIRLAELKPYPEKDKEISFESYRIGLIVESE